MNSDQQWSKVANLKPRIRDHVSFIRQVYRGETWYIYQDHSTNKFHQLDYSSHRFLSLMDGKRSIQDIFQLIKSTNKETYSKDDIFRLLGQLHRIDLLQTNARPDSQELYYRSQQLGKNRWKAFLRNPISFRVSLFDPDTLLATALPAVRPLFSWPLLFALLVFFVLSILSTSIYWPELASQALEQALLPTNLALLILIYPFIKLLHELGHAFSVKYWGGEVHEIGLIFVLLLPIPYVDASAASAFPHKYQRIIVDSAGIIVELVLACIALFVWLGVEPGIVKTIAFNVMLITGISTLLFNGNPLLRYDGYFVFSDAIEIPNLATRSNRYIGYLIQRYFLRIQNTRSPTKDTREIFWLFCYSPAAFVYRMTILLVIVMLVADQQFVIGALLGIWILYNQVILPIISHFNFILFSPKLNHHRKYAIISSSAVTLTFVSLLFSLPVPLVTITQGVIWPPDNARVHADSAGFVEDILIEPGSHVTKGEVLIVVNDPLLSAQINILNAQLDELNTQYLAAWSTDRVQSKIIKEQMLSVQEDIKQVNNQINALLIHSPINGKIIIPNARNLKGQYLKKGDFVAYIDDLSTTTARTVIQQDDAGLLTKVDSVNVTYSGDISKSIQARIKQIIPEVSHQLPSAALGTVGGGNIPVDPLDKSGLTALEKVQQIELELDAKDAANNTYIGKRIFVRFDHGTAPLVQQWYKSFQQLLLRRFSV